MDTLAAGKKVLENAEEAIRALMSDAAGEGKYDTVVLLASWARQVSEITHSTASESPHLPTSKAPVPTQLERNATRKAIPDTKKLSRSKSKTYPRFGRSGNTLVKIAWSKAAKTEYEHRAPFEVVEKLRDALTSAVKTSPLVSTDDIFPLTTNDGDDIPAYQSYLCLAWLLEIGLVRKHGRRGYSIIPEADLTRGIQAAWDHLPMTN